MIKIAVLKSNAVDSPFLENFYKTKEKLKTLNILTIKKVFCKYIHCVFGILPNPIK